MTTLSTTRVTIEKDVTPAVAAALYTLYRAAFAHLEDRAAARHLLHEEEFLEEMADPRILKYVAWGADAAPIGLCTVTNSLDAVPWISPGFYAHEYPEHHARGAIYYVGITMVHPSMQGAGAFREIVRRLGVAAASDRAVLAWDLCEHNQSAGLHRLFSTMLDRVVDVSVSEIDRQIYYGAVVNGSREGT